MAKVTSQAMVAAGVLAFFITIVSQFLIGNPLFGFWLDWLGWFSCILCVYYKWF